MVRKAIVALLLLLALAVSNAQASLQAVIHASPGGANDAEALEWLDNVLGVTGLTEIGSDNTQTGRSGTWTIDDPSVQPQYWIVKFAGLVAIYSYDGPGSNPWSDSWDLNAEVFQPTTGNQGNLLVNIVDVNNNVLYAAGAYSGSMGRPNANAGTSHVTIFGGPAGVVPEPGTLLIWAGLATVGAVATYRRRK